MTAEVAVMNKSAVALAADSKVTVGAAGAEKTYDTVNKIFTLSKVHPVGVMIYGNADFMEYPWETIVKLYRQKKKGLSFPTIEAWGEDFWRYVRAFKSMTKNDKARNIKSVLHSVFFEIQEEAVYRAQLKNVAQNSKEYYDIVLSLIEAQSNRALRQKKWASLKYAQATTSAHWRAIVEVVTHYFKRNTKPFDKALELAVAFLLQHSYSAQRSGVVIAGFGDKDIFPGYVHYISDGYIGSKIKNMRMEPNRIALDNSSAIEGFAQGDIVHRFMEGIDPSYSNFLQGLVSTALHESNLKVLEKYAPKLKTNTKVKKEIEKRAQAQYDELYKRARQFRYQRFTMQILDMVALLPKDELASLAESLVALTSLHRRVSRELETVGGAVDVAIISKSEGFIWVKRKHYFKAELNPHFEHNYMRDT